jgi:acyl-CoA reductase-like NAD-dependent aldehyde dehydrogenase
MPEASLLTAIDVDPAPDDLLVVHNPYSGDVIESLIRTPARAMPDVVDRARRARGVAAKMSRAMRAAILDDAARAVQAQQKAYAQLIVAESGKTITQARKEVARAVNTLALSAAEARRNAGEVVPFDAYSGSERRQGWFTREPLGIIAAITPYNDPLNLVAHKLGPAIAGGNSIILKPSELAPLSALRLVQTLIDAGLPSDIVSVVLGGREVGQALVAANEVRMVSFTGGFATGEAIARSAGLKRLAMDLGGNAPVIVLADANLSLAAEACVSGSFWAAGQNCIGTQRILIERSCYEEFRSAFVTKTSHLQFGDPALESTDVGPMISPAAAQAAKAKIEAALAQSATLLWGNELSGSVLSPTVLEDVPPDCDIWQQEAFAPVVVLQPVDSLDAAIVRANEIDFSLHAGIFTSNLDAALRGAAELEAGGVMVNDSSDYRFDAMPFGGFKYGSLGREGVRFAYEDMTQPKVICINSVARR